MSDAELRQGEHDVDLAPEVRRRLRCRAGDCELDPQTLLGKAFRTDPQGWVTMPAVWVTAECPECGRNEERVGPYEISGLSLQFDLSKASGSVPLL